MGGHLGQVYCTFEGIQETVDDVLPQRNTELASASMTVSETYSNADVEVQCAVACRTLMPLP